MKLIEWTKNLFKDGVELFRDEVEIVKNNTTIKRNTKRLRLCSIGLISSKNSKEWYNVCRLNSEPGTIIEEYTEEWELLYNDMLTLAKLQLTQSLLTERFSKSAKVFIEILERRMKDEWSKDSKKQTEVKAQSGNVNFEFTIVE